MKRSILPIDGTSNREVREAPAEYVNHSPAWAPGGGSLYFVSNRQGVMDIYTLGVSPDGRAIVYVDQAPGGGLFLLRRGSAGAWGVPESLRPQASRIGAWLPDGRAVYVTRDGAVEAISIDTRHVQMVYAPGAGRPILGP